MRKRIGALVALGLALAATNVVLATDDSDVQAELIDNPNAVDPAIDEITVRARKKDELLQSTPIAVTAFSARDLEERRIEEMAHINGMTPNLLFSMAGPTPNRARIYIRGVGQDDPIATSDPGVGMYVDGVYLGRAVGANFDLVDIASIEVLRGPQGTLYGKNTPGGAILVNTGRPTGDLDPFMKLTYGTNNRVGLQGALGFPIGDELGSGRVSFQSNYREGYFDNKFSDSQWDNDRSMSARGKFAFDLTPELSLVWGLDKTRTREHPIGGALISTSDCSITNPASAGFPVCNLLIPGVYGLHPLFGTWAPGADDPHEGNLNDGRGPSGDPSIGGGLGAYASRVRYGNPGQNDLDAQGTSLTADWGIPSGMALKSITAWRQHETHQYLDVDGAAFTLLEQLQNDEQWQFSQEFQIQGEALNDMLGFTTGLFYFYEDADFKGTSFQAPLARLAAPANPLANPSVYEGFGANNHSIAAFGNFEYMIDDQWTGEFGLRLTFDRKDFDRKTTPIFTDTAAPPPFSASDDDRWLFLSPRLGLSYQIDDDKLSYWTASVAQKAGGFNGRAGDNPLQLEAYDPETVYATEVGLKSQWLDSRLQTNLAAFFNYYRDIQLTTFTASPAGFLSLVENAAEARIFGFEAEVRAVPRAGMDMFASLGITNARYMEFDLADRNAAAATPGTVDMTDSWFKNTPSYTFALGGTYTFPAWFGGSLSIGSDYAFQSKVHFGVENNDTTAQSAYGVLNSRIAWQSEDGLRELAIFGKNLFDREYKSYALDFTDSIGHTIGYWAPVRTFAVEATIRY